MFPFGTIRPSLSHVLGKNSFRPFSPTHFARFRDFVLSKFRPEVSHGLAKLAFLSHVHYVLSGGCGVCLRLRKRYITCVATSVLFGRCVVRFGTAATCLVVAVSAFRFGTAAACLVVAVSAFRFGTAACLVVVAVSAFRFGTAAACLVVAVSATFVPCALFEKTRRSYITGKT